MNDKLIDNSSEILMMRNILKKCFSNEDITTVRIATGYWDIPGLSLLTEEIRRFLEKDGTKLLLLIGKDPYVYASQMAEGRQEKLKKFPQDYIRTDIQNLELKEEYIPAINLLLDYCGDSEDSKIQIKIFKTNEQNEVQFMHSKCYIFEGKDKDSSDIGYGIIGSSNFTQKGLEDNAELNYLVTSPYVVIHAGDKNNKTHKQWFNEKWEDSDPWSKEFLEQIIKPAKITKKAIEKKEKEKQLAQIPLTPYELYIKLLQLKFGDVVDSPIGQQIESYLPENIHDLKYQIEAVKRCISIMHEHGGFMLADVVGLGKTIIGMLIIKRFLMVPEDDGRERKVLVITPPAIQSAWKKTLKVFDKDFEEKITPFIDFITTGSIGSINDDEEMNSNDEDFEDTGDFSDTLQEKNYGLIIIDESHKFRNSNTIMYQSLDDLIQKIGAETGVFPYVGLISATPQNNRPNDLKNQIYLFERFHNDSTLKRAEGGNLEKFFSETNKEYDLLINRKNYITPEERTRRLKALSKKIRDCILSDILERRTRTDIKKYYKDDIEEQHLTFPEIVGPIGLEYQMDDELAQLFYDTMTIVAPSESDKLFTDDYLRYYRYRAIEYFSKPEYEKKYVGRGNRGVDDVAKQLATIMQILLVKRLESSFTAFRQSLLNLRRYTENMINMWENDTIFICPQININNELNAEAKSKKRGRKVEFKDCIEDIRKKIQKLNEESKNKKKQNAEYKREDFREEYYELLKKDYKLISSLYDRWAKNSEDPKFDCFKEKLKSELFDKKKNTSGKLVIFSEAIDTVNSLSRTVKNQGFKPLTITAANRNDMEQTIEENFDANYEGEWKNDYDVIITTEVLAEGINLHRANVILNYDTPWNSTRLMQRIGRVNRIGSKEPKVYVFNFMPSAPGDSQIKLIRKAHTKLQSFHIMFGEDSKIFSEDEYVIHYDLTQAVEGEESPLEKYVFELKQYKEQHPERYKQIEQEKDGWQIAQAETGDAYFVVKAPKSARLAVCVKQDENVLQGGRIISLIDMLEQLKVDEQTKRVELPENWSMLIKQATTTYSQYFINLNKSRVGDKRTKALDIIVNLYNSDKISDHSKGMLQKARILANKGSFDIIKKMIAIGAEIEDRNNMFPITQQEIDDILEREIGRLVANVQKRLGNPEIILGTIK